jgi:hypothetical protein
MDDPHRVISAPGLSTPTSYLDEIRLVRILPGAEDEAISCVLQSFSLCSCPTYTALSYFCGDPSITETVYVNGSQQEVMTNLASFLRCYRSAADGATELCWIDAICINQKDVAERNREMLRMKDIYQSADMIIAWLGPAADGSDQAMYIVEHLAGTYSQLRSDGNIIPDLRTCHPMHEHVWTSLEKLLERPYWFRIWILQEASTPLDKSGIFVVCGRLALPIDLFFAADDCLRVVALQSHSLFYDRIYSGRIGILAGWMRQRREEKLDLLSIISHLNYNDATDPRDKIYAILPAAVDGQREELRPDYSLPTAEVYTNLASYLIKRDSDLDILNYCHLDQNISGLPSWVPDWTVKYMPWAFFERQRHPDGSYTQLYTASLNTRALAQFLPEKRRLRIHGIFFDDIVGVSLARVDENLDVMPIKDLIANWVEIALEGDDAYVTGGTKMEALQHTLCADLQWTDDTDLARGGFLTWPDAGAGQDRWATFELSPILKPVTRYRRLIKTSTAYLGIVSYDTLPGDIVCILFGGSLPMVLRPVDDHFLLVGLCYVHGIMDGEALQGADLKKETRIFEIW